jgi:hypothetical protein
MHFPLWPCWKGWVALWFLGALPAVAQEVRILERGANHNVIRRVSVDRDRFGSNSTRTNTWVQLEDGLNFWDPKAGDWRESREEIQLAGLGATALHGPMRAIFSSNANDPNGALDLEIQGQVRLRSSILALRYFDAATGGTAVLGTVRDVRGELLPPNQVIYRNVFDGISADLVYTYRKRGVESDVVLREVPPGPEEFGLIPETTRIEVVTEFFDPPEPIRKQELLATLDEPELREAVAEPDWVDEDLNFGPNRIAEGRAFAWSAREAAQARPEGFARVAKRWLRIEDGRTLLIESAEYVGLFDDLLDLPGTVQRKELLRQRSQQWAGKSASDLRTEALRRHGETRVGSAGRWDAAPGRWSDADWALLLRPRSVESAIEGGIQLSAVGGESAPGLVLDWITLTTGTANFTFAATNTYYVTGNCSFTGTTTLEGGAVIKFPATGATITGVQINGPLVCRTSFYLPVVFTAESDNTVGETIVAGVPVAATDYGTRQLRFNNTGIPIEVEHIRFKHGFEALSFQGWNPDNRVRHCQFVNARFPVSNSANTPVRLGNVLIHGGKSSGVVFSGAFTPFIGEHLTIHQAPSLLTGGSLALTNSIIAAVTSVQSYSGAGNWQAATSTGLFDAVGAGHHYLAPSSPLRDSGVPEIDPVLQRDLVQLTTDAPALLGADFGVETNLVVRARRDSDKPDLGYHYAPLDFAVGERNLINGTVRMLDGLALGVYGTSGIRMGAGAVLESNGSALRPNRIVHFTQVQEQTVSAWASPTGDLGLLELSGLGVGTVPELRWVFTEAFMPNGPAHRRQWIRQSWAGAVGLRLTHSQLTGLTLNLTGTYPGGQIALTNNLLKDVELRVTQSSAGGFHPLAFRAFNNLFRGGTLALTNSRVDSPWVIQDNLFDPLELSVSGLNGTLSHNGFRAGLPVFGVNNRTGLVMDYIEGPIGPFSYPTLGSSTSLASLLDVGSRGASTAGVSLFSLRSDGAPELNSVVDIGFHYPASGPSTSGLVGYWRMDESSGTTANDSSANALHGSLLNGAIHVRGVLGNGVNLDGINDQVRIEDSPALRLTNGFTIAFWTRKHSENADYTLYVGKGGPMTRNFAVWDHAGASGRLLLQFQDPNGLYRSIGGMQELVVGRWYHVACTWDGATGRIYIDGSLDATGAMPGVPAVTSEPLLMGFAGYHGRMAGLLDEVAIYNRALSGSEVVGLMSSRLPGVDPTPRLGHWRLDERTGGVAGDSSGRGLHGQLSFGPQWVAGRLGNGLSLNGVDDVVTIPDAPSLRLTNAFTIAMWVNKAAEPADFSRLIGKGGVLTRNFGVWDVAGPSGKVLFQFQTPQGQYRSLTSSRELVLGTWHHLACAWDGSIGRIYIDGVLDSATAMPGPVATSSEPVTMGFAGYHTYFPGRLDEAVLFDRALAVGEVSMLMSNSVPVAGLAGTRAAWPLNASSGGQAVDTSGNGHHGSLSIGPRWVAGKSGSALSLDGVTESVSIPDHPALRPTQAFTLAFWVRKQTEHPDFVRYVGKGGPLVRNFGVWDRLGSDGRVMFQFQDGSAAYRTVVSLRSIPVGSWHHVACSWDGAVGRIYINGLLDASASMPGPPATSTDPLTFGYAGYHGRLAGELDEVELYGRALSASEIADLTKTSPADSDFDGVADVSEDRNGNGVRDAGESSLVDADSDYDGRSDSEERADGTDPLNPRSVKPVRLGMWLFDQPADPWRADNGAMPWEVSGVDLVEMAPFANGVELDSAGAVLRYRDVEANGGANVNARQGTVRLLYYPYWASQSPDCPPGTAGFGPGSPIELVSVGDFSIGIDAKGTNLVLRSPNPAGGYITNAQAAFRACNGDYFPDFPTDIQVAYATNASAIFQDGRLLARGSGIQSVPNRGSRTHGFFIGSSPDRTRQIQGALDAVFTYNVPLNLVTNASSLSLVVSNAPPSVTLKWTAVSNGLYRIDRRSGPQSAWQTIASVFPPSYTDASIVPGQEYEYRLTADLAVPEEFRASSDPAPLTMVSGLQLPVVDAPGHVLLVVDRTLTNNATYASAINAVTRDLSSEGWVVVRYGGPRHDDDTWSNNPAGIAQLKNWITGYRNSFPTQTKAVLLFGHLPIPRSGLLSPDGHLYRPLPADSYYADLDGVWTDVGHWPLAPGVSVPNLAGDGIFDQELVPPNAAGVAAVELAVGRVDFANMPVFAAATPSLGELDLLARYANKTRRYRRAELTLPERAIYGGYFASNAVSEAQNVLAQHLTRLGTRLGSAVVGTNASGAIKADFFDAGLPAVWGVLGGFAGGYDSIHSRGEVWAYHGVSLHRTSDLVPDAAEPPIAFSLIHASWMPEWNAPDHLGRGLLSTKNYGYAWSFAGATQIEWQYPSMALGRTIGEAWLKTQNDAWMWPWVPVQFQSPFGAGTRVYLGVPSHGGYVFGSLLGDPTLRQAPPAPPGTLNGQVVGQGEIAFTWIASPEPGATYHVYRANAGIGTAWTRLTSTPLAGTSFTDLSPPSGSPAYMVRALVFRQVASGTLTNLSAGSVWP